MTHSNEKMHVYLREIKQDERTSLSVLASFITPGTKVLDLGTGSGALGKHLSTHGIGLIDGVTYNAAEADVARPYYGRIEVADLDAGTWAAAFEEQRYDFIVCADVLEHLKGPENVLAACRQLLTPTGRVLISIPNVGYSGLIAELLSGEFRYRDEGLLDRTHLKFFTRHSLTRFLGSHGWELDSIDSIHRDVPESEFGANFDRLPPAVSRYLLAAPDALTYQFIAVARPLPQGSAAANSFPAQPDPNARALFSSQLYLGLAGAYAEQTKLVASGVIGDERQTLVFRLPATGAPASSLRFDPADRPGFVWLHGMTLKAADGTVLWQWRGDAEGFAALEAAAHHDIVMRPPWPASAATPMLLHGEDPWFELPLPPGVTADPQALLGASFEAEMGWPMSADYLALSETAGLMQARIDAAQRAAADDHRSMEAALGQLDQAIQRERREAQDALARERREANDALSIERGQREQADADLLALREQKALLVEQGRLLTEQKNALLRHQRALEAERDRLSQERQGLVTHLQFIENSTIFRATRPLVNFKMRIDQLRHGAPAPAPATGPGATTERPERFVPSGTPVPVDVIVPVYRGLDDTRRCIESALASVSRTPMRLVVINDASPEPEVTAWLRSLEGRDPRLLLLENAENLGFVGTVNRGMALSQQSDVVLLNSDAEVANDWLDRIFDAAYSDRRVATVTPFSNNATICSYPRFCAANELPAGYHTAQLDRLFAQTHPGQVIDVPTGVGFCMYIRRDCLDAVGLFDEESFGKGYGEENDFCRRAADAGWRNLHALDVFVRHAGGGSFGETKSTRELAAMDTLRRLHPNYERVVHAFVADDPAREFRQAIDIARLREAGLPVVLAVVHDRAGGTVRHVDELAAHLHDKVSFLKLTPGGGGNVLLTRPDPFEAFELSFRVPEEFDDLVQLLREMGVVHVHFHHLIGHALEVLALPRRLGVRYDFTAHDYYTFCPQISLTDASNTYCGELGVDQCRSCLQKSPAPGGADIETWRAAHGTFVTEARHVLVPSMDAARRFSGYWRQANIRFAPHTDLIGETLPPATAPRQLEGKAPLRIAVIGALSSIKGADVLEDVAVAAARAGAALDFHLIGFAYRSLRTQPKARLTVHGEYDDKDLPRLLEWLQPDLVWFPAQWPETYSYTLSACLKAGLPVVAPDLGAFADRVTGRGWTWVRPWAATPATWLAFFQGIRAQHFATGTPPARVLPPVSDGADVLVRAWSYADDYLGDTPAPSPIAPVSMAFLAAHRPGREEGLRASQQMVKRGLLQTIVRLRSAPGLRGVARAIPLRWQTRIKTWLRA